MDMSISLYQFICFPLYGIPKVKRQDYIVFDRQYLHYLNFIEKSIALIAVMRMVLSLMSEK